MKYIQWGIIGTGRAARNFAQGLRFLPEAKLSAIGSRTLASAREFAHEFNVPFAHQNYEELANNKYVDVVYIATPNNRHKEDCLLCLNSGKAVLCEKPFTINAHEAREVIALAREKKLFCMEAMSMRFFPLMQKVKEIIQNDVIGEVCTLSADFGNYVAFNPNDRHFNPQLGGGALLDRGVYTLSLAFQILGKPSQITSQALIGKSGVDEQTAILLSYPQGALAILLASLRTNTSNEAVIMGNKGKIIIHKSFYCPDKLSIIKSPQINTPLNQLPYFKHKFKSDLKKISFLQNTHQLLYSYLHAIAYKPYQQIMLPLKGNGYNYEAAEVMRCLKSGNIESQIMPLNDTLCIIETMDTIRQQWDFK